MTRPVDRRGLRPRAAAEELGRLLPAEQTSPSVVQRIADPAAGAVPDGVEVPLTPVRGKHPTTAAPTGRPAAALAEDLVLTGESTLVTPGRRPPPAGGARPALSPARQTGTAPPGVPRPSTTPLEGTTDDRPR